jgi:hypothetical protein
VQWQFQQRVKGKEGSKRVLKVVKRFSFSLRDKCGGRARNAAIVGPARWKTADPEPITACGCPHSSYKCTCASRHLDLRTPSKSLHHHAFHPLQRQTSQLIRSRSVRNQLLLSYKGDFHSPESNLHSQGPVVVDISELRQPISVHVAMRRASLTMHSG